MAADCPETETTFLAALGSLVLAFNHTEDALRKLLSLACFGHHTSIETIIASKILTSELGSVTMSNILRAYDDLIGPKELSKPIEATLKYFDQVRLHRNHYVHGISTVVNTTDGGLVGWIHRERNKGTRLVEYKEIVFLADIEKVSGYCRDVTGHLGQTLVPLWSLICRFP